MVVKVTKGAKPVQLTARVTSFKKAALPTREAALVANALESEDEFATSYFTTDNPEGDVIVPPFDLNSLLRCGQQNNTLDLCITAYEVNIDGTGNEIKRKDEKEEGAPKPGDPNAAKPPFGGKPPFGKPSFPPKKPGEAEAADEDEEEVKKFQPPTIGKPPAQNAAPDNPTGSKPSQAGDIGEEADGQQAEPVDPEIEKIQDFFDEPFPSKSFITIRREMRRDLEAVGVAYLEVMRDLTGEIAFVNNVEARTMRLVKLGNAVNTDVEVRRNGAVKKYTLAKRHRRFIQIVGTKKVYFKEFGIKVDLDKTNGKWGVDGYTVKPENRASEIIFFKVNPDYRGPYGVPRWIQQIPSVLGSRKAEELNLDFFEAGGIPPVLLLIAGGQLGTDTRTQLEAALGGDKKKKSNNRVAIAEIHPSAGSLDQAGQVKVGVERFGAERQQDSMFENYDEKCEKRVRGSFRLPPLFVGRMDDFNFATAYTAYTVAEAQVFAPERKEFDEIINNTLMKEMWPEYKYVSKPLTVKDIETYFRALELAMQHNAVTPQTLIDALNKVTDIELPEPPEDAGPPNPFGGDLEALLANGGKPPEEGDGPPFGQPKGKGGTAGDKAQPPGKPPFAKKSVKKQWNMDPEMLADLASLWARHVTDNDALDGGRVNAMKQLITSLSDHDRSLFNSMVAMKASSHFDEDPRGMETLCRLTHDLVG